jgi:hypothetical protein
MRRVWTGSNGEPLVEAFSITGMAHGVPLASTSGSRPGTAGAFFLDVGISSTDHIARFWHLDEFLVESPRATALASAPIQVSTGGALVNPGAAREGWHSSAEDYVAEREEQQTYNRRDPNAVIAAAFRAAGLPVPEISRPPPGASPRVAPGPIIAAALKAAGLAQS